MTADVCYICYDSELPKDPLKSPCKCKGSMAWIHESCLAEWLKTTRRDHCQHCHWKYQATKPLPQSVDFVQESCSWLKQVLRKLMFLFLMGLITLYCGYSLILLGGATMKILFGVYLSICLIMLLPILMNRKAFHQAYVRNQQMTALRGIESPIIRDQVWWLCFVINLMIAHHQGKMTETSWLEYVRSIPDLKK